SRHTRFSRDWSSDVCSSDLRRSRTASGRFWRGPCVCSPDAAAMLGRPGARVKCARGKHRSRGRGPTQGPRRGALAGRAGFPRGARVIDHLSLANRTLPDDPARPSQPRPAARLRLRFENPCRLRVARGSRAPASDAAEIEATSARDHPMSFSNDAQGVDLPASAALEPAAPPPAPSPASDPPGSGSDLEAVPQPLRDALARRGFARLTEVQHAVLRALADEGAARDLRLSSQTGSGKTVAIGLALAPGLAAPVEPARPRLAALLVVPTRELAEQVARELRWLFAGLPEAAIECVTGGTSVGDEQRRLGRGPRVLVATPGRLLDHVRSGALDPSGVSQLVLDEADQMLDLGFRDDLDAILAALPAQRRTILVSATFPREVERLVERFQREPLLVTGTAPGAANADIEHRVYRVAPRDRYAALVNLLLCADG